MLNIILSAGEKMFAITINNFNNHFRKIANNGARTSKIVDTNDTQDTRCRDETSNEVDVRTFKIFIN